MSFSRIAVLAGATAVLSLASAQAATKSANVSQSKSTYRYNDSGFGNRFEIEPSFGMAFIGPSDINTLIRDNNDNIQKQGLKSFNVSEIGSSTAFGLATTYRFAPGIGLGLGINRIGTTSEGTGTQNGTNLTGKYSVGATLLTVESRITMARSADGKWEGLLSPFAGIGFYSADQEFSGNALANSIEVQSSASGIVLGSLVGARYWFAENLGIGLNAGYRYAKSGNLKVDSQKNTTVAVGSDVDNGGKKVQLNASSFVIATQFVWAL